MIDRSKFFSFIKEAFQEKKFNLLVVFLYAFVLFFFMQRVVDFIIFIVALLLGMLLFILDKKYLATYYHEKPEEDFYVTQSALFLFSLIPLALYVFTSAGSFWALGIMSGIFIFLLVEMRRLMSTPTLFFDHFLQGMKVEVSEKKARFIFYVFFAFFVLLHLFVIL